MSLSDTLNSYIKNGVAKTDNKKTGASNSGLNDTLANYIKTGAVTTPAKKAAAITPAVTPVAKTGLNEAGKKAFLENPYSSAPAPLLKSQAPKINPNLIEPIKINTGTANSTQAIPDANTPNIGINEVIGAPVGVLGGAIGGIVGAVGGSIVAQNKGLKGKEYWNAVGNDSVNLAKEMYNNGTDIGAAGTKLGVATAVAPAVVGVYFTAMTGKGIYDTIVKTKNYADQLKAEGGDNVGLNATYQYLKNGGAEGFRLLGLDEETIGALNDNSFFNAVGNVLLYGGAYLAGKGTLKSAKPKVAKLSDFLTKDKIIEYKLPETVKISSQEVYDIYSGKAAYEGNLTTVEKGELLSTLNLTSQEINNARNNGISIERPTEVITKLADKPWFAKIKKSLNIEPTEQIIGTDKLGVGKQAPAGLLTEGIKDSVNKTNLEIEKAVSKNTDPAPAIIEQATVANKSLDVFTEANKKPVIFYEGTKPLEGEAPMISLDVVKYDNGKFGTSYEASLNDASLSAPFSVSPEFTSEQAAILDAKEKIKGWIEENKQETWQNNLEIQNIVKALEENTLNKVAQPTQAEVKPTQILSKENKSLTEDSFDVVNKGLNANGWSSLEEAQNVGIDWVKKEFPGNKNDTLTPFKQGKVYFIGINKAAVAEVPAEIPEAIQNKADQEWEDNPKYGEKVGELSAKRAKLENDLKTEKDKIKKAEIQKQIDDINKQIQKIQDGFVKKWQDLAKGETPEKKIVKTDYKKLDKIELKKLVIAELEKMDGKNLGQIASKFKGGALSEQQIIDIGMEFMKVPHTPKIKISDTGKGKYPKYVNEAQWTEGLTDKFGDTVKLYHQTDAANIPEILKNGFKAGEKFGDDIFFVMEEKINRVGEGKGLSHLIVTVPKSSYDRLFPDERSMEGILTDKQLELEGDAREELMRSYILNDKTSKGFDILMIAEDIKPEWIASDVKKEVSAAKETPTPKEVAPKKATPRFAKPKAEVSTQPLIDLAKKSSSLIDYTEKATKLMADNPALEKAVDKIGFELMKTNPEADFSLALANIYRDNKVAAKITPAITDFGERIGGAKKELWSKRGLNNTDLIDMNQREVEKYLKKDNIWLKNYDELVTQGIPEPIVMFIKNVRDSLPPKIYYLRSDNTPELKTARNEQYISFIKEVRDAVNQVKNLDDVRNFWDKFTTENGYVEKVPSSWDKSHIENKYTQKQKDNPFLTDKFRKASKIYSGFDVQRLIDDAKAQQFGVSEGDKMPKGIEVRMDNKDNSWFVAKRSGRFGQILKDKLASEAEANKWIKDNVQGITKTTSKRKFIPPQLSSIHRTGIDYRPSNKNVTGEDFIKEFGFKGGEFGNWLNEKDRQVSLNYAFDALKDLSDALGIAPKNVALDGTLNIAFGSRGVAGAAAHYEPDRKVFNLTKMNGAGSTAHEWFHALEDFLGVEGAKLESFKTLKDTLKYKEATPAEVEADKQKSIAKYSNNIKNSLANVVEYRQSFKDLSEAQKAEYNRLKDLVLGGDSQVVKGALDVFVKKATGKMIPNDTKYRLEFWSRYVNQDLAKEVRTGMKISTQFKKDAVSLDSILQKSQGYWQSEEEMLARSFASYITDKTKGNSDYLSGHSESPIEFQDSRKITGFPVGEERTAINKAFDNFFADLKDKGIFTNREVKPGEIAKYSIKDINSFENYNQGIQALDQPFNGEKLMINLRADMKRLGLNFDTQLFDRIFTGEMAKQLVTGANGVQTLKITPQTAAGVKAGNSIFLAKESLRFADKHELGHLILDNLDNIPAFKDYNKADLLSEASQVYGKKYTDSNLEEVIQRGLEDFTYNRTAGWSGKLKGFFAKLLYQIKQILKFTRKINLKSYYEDILYSKAEGVTNLEKISGLARETVTGGKRTIDFSRGSKANFQKIEFNPEDYVKEMTDNAKEAGDSKIKGIKNLLVSLAKEAKNKFVDFSAPIEDLLYKTTKKEGIFLKPSEDIHNQIDRVLRSPVIAGQFLRDSGLFEVVKNVDNINNLDQYLIAKHAIELDKSGINTGRDLEKDQQLIDAFKGKYEIYAQKVYNFSRQLLDYSVGSGLISPELAVKLKEIYPDYVPFNRVFTEIERNQGGTNSKSIASLGRQSIVQKIEGSNREIESPIASLISKTNDAFKQGEKNKAARLLVSYKDLPGNPFGLEEVTDSRPLQPGEKTINVLVSGQKRTFVTLPEIANAAKSLDVQTLGVIGRIAAFPTRVARIGITGANIPFVAANILKDQVSAFINSNNSLKTSIANPKVFWQGFLQAVGHGDLYQELLREGGGGTSYDISRNQISQTVARIRASRSLPSRIAFTVTHPGDLLRAVENIIGRSEEFTRIKQALGTKQALLKQGMDVKEARIAAVRAYNEDTVNFARRGEWGTVLNSALLYINAGIQGTRTLLRSFKNKPAATSVKVAFSVLLPVVLATIYNLKNDDTKKVYDDIPEWEKQNNLILIPPNTEKNADGTYKVIKIPLSQEINNLASLTRNFVESLYGGDKVGFGKLAGAVFGTVTPFSPDLRQTISQLVPQLVKPTVESLANTSLFTGSNIVNEYAKSLPAEQQVYPDTSGTARKIGAAINVSPLKVQFFLKETFGETALQALNLSDKTLFALGLIPEEQVGGRSIQTGILRRFMFATAGATDQATQDELTTLLGDKSNAVFKAKQALLPTYTKINDLAAAGDEAGAQNIIDNLSDDDYVTYKLLKKADAANETKKAKLQIFDKYNEVQSLYALEKNDEATQILDAMTDTEYKAYQSLKTSLKDTPAEAGNADSKVADNLTTTSEGGLIANVALYAKALGTDPVTAFNRIFTGQRIVKLVNGTIIVERMSLSESQAIKEEQNGMNADWKLDHTVPLELGGSNSPSNLKLVPTDVWASYTNKENELGAKLRAGEITKKEAQEQIKAFKENLYK